MNLGGGRCLETGTVTRVVPRSQVSTGVAATLSETVEYKHMEWI